MGRAGHAPQRSRSSASAIASASGFISITARSVGPLRIERLDPLDIRLHQLPGGALPRLHRRLELGNGLLLQVGMR